MSIKSSGVISVIEAAMSLTTGKGRLFETANIPDNFLEWLDVLAKTNQKTKIFKPCANHLYAAMHDNDRFLIKSINDVDTDLVSVRWDIMMKYYNSIPNARYGTWSAMNRARMAFLPEISPLKAKELVHYASAGMWELCLHKSHGFYIKQNHLYMSNLIHIVDMNYDITYNLGRLSRIHSNGL